MDSQTLLNSTGLTAVQSKGEGITFTQKSVQYAWAAVASEKWCQAKDPIESAQIYLEKHGPENHIKVLNISEIPGTRTLAFIVDDFMREWAPYTDTFLVDLTCESNIKAIMLVN